MFGFKRSQKKKIARAFEMSASAREAAAHRPKLRRARRADTWCPCTIAYDSGDVVNAILLDWSAEGARIRFVSNGRLNGRAKLKAPRVGLDQPVNIIWQNRGEAGVAFG